jgi:hypothetical protein
MVSQYPRVACSSIGTQHTSRRIDEEHIESTTNESGQLNNSTDSDTCQTLTPRLHRCGRCHCENAVLAVNPVVGEVHVRHCDTSGTLAEHSSGTMQGREDSP